MFTSTRKNYWWSVMIIVWVLVLGFGFLDRFLGITPPPTPQQSAAAQPPRTPKTVNIHPVALSPLVFQTSDRQIVIPDEIQGSFKYEYQKDDLRSIVVDFQGDIGTTRKQANIYEKKDERFVSRWSVSEPPLYFGENKIDFTITFTDGRVAFQNFSITIGPRVNPVEGDLEIQWNEPVQQVTPIELFGVEPQDAALPSKNQTYGDIRIVRTGQVRGGNFAGQVLYTVSQDACQIECYTESLFRVLKDTKTGVLTYLTRYSAMYGSSVDFAIKMAAQAPNIRISDLERPDELVMKGIKLLKVADGYSRGRLSTEFDYSGGTEFPTLMNDPRYGMIYELSSGLLAMRLKDERFVTYEYYLPFVTTSTVQQPPDDHSGWYGMGTGIPKIFWNDGTKSTEPYVFVDVACEYISSYAVRSATDLVPEKTLVIGGRTDTGDPIYVPKDANNAAVRLIFYRTLSSYLEHPQKINSPEFLLDHPVFYWKDPFDRWIRFVKSKIYIIC